MEGRPGFVIAGWCGSGDCEATIKAETQATLRNIPFGSEKRAGTCVKCGKPSNVEAWLREGVLAVGEPDEADEKREKFSSFPVFSVLRFIPCLAPDASIALTRPAPARSAEWRFVMRSRFTISRNAVRPAAASVRPLRRSLGGARGSRHDSSPIRVHCADEGRGQRPRPLDGLAQVVERDSAAAKRQRLMQRAAYRQPFVVAALSSAPFALGHSVRSGASARPAPSPRDGDGVAQAVARSSAKVAARAHPPTGLPDPRTVHRARRAHRGRPVQARGRIAAARSRRSRVPSRAIASSRSSALTSARRTVQGGQQLAKDGDAGDRDVAAGRDCGLRDAERALVSRGFEHAQDGDLRSRSSVRENSAISCGTARVPRMVSRAIAASRRSPRRPGPAGTERPCAGNRSEAPTRSVSGASSGIPTPRRC